MRNRSVLLDAGRGALTGAAVVAGGFVAYLFGDWYARGTSNNYTNSADAFGDFAFAFLFAAVVLCAAGAYLAAWLCHLRRPLLIAIGGNILSVVAIVSVLSRSPNPSLSLRLVAEIAVPIVIFAIVGAAFSTRSTREVSASPAAPRG
ncbi:hypothetical protein HDA40_006288 [Hamadaea flava]|uniref:Uncharacterized protein n=1 Tax=Hamadaea flava TaxID=1742688 RepID=A0ABV8LV13_9ACTN|nr:hypothetical protein [Hamadaea flava]MCP2327781.1 hypothetical protein [Hamadaea flava]